MKKKILFTVALAMLLAMPLGSAFSYEAFIGPTGVLQYNKDKSYGGYTLFSMTGAGNTKSYLMDMEGWVVHDWKTDYVAGLHDVLLPNGNLLRGQATYAAPQADPTLKVRQQKYDNAIISVGGGHAGFLQEFDWNGNVVWEYEWNTPTATSHHTFTPHPSNNGNVLILGWEWKSRDECIAKGRNPATVGPRGLWPEVIIEVNRAKQIVWEYHAWDNLIQNFDPTKANYGEPKDNLDKFDINWICAGAGTAAGIADWQHWNTANYTYETPERVVANSRHWGESYIIDKTTKKLVWRWGNPSAYGMGMAPEFMNDGTQLLWGPHHAHMIAPGLPGAGHMMILDNGWNRPAGNRTRTVEVDITKPSSTSARVAFSATGAMTTFTNINPGTLVWQYFSNTPNSLYSASQCSNQRLPNGNTVITSTQSTAHLIEVTPGYQNAAGNWVDKDVVWEFISPLLTDDDVYGVFQTDRPGSIHRSTRYGTDYVGLKGRDLTRKYHISGTPEFWKMLSDVKEVPNSTLSRPTNWQPGGSFIPTLPSYTGFGFGSVGITAGGGGAGTGGGAGGGGY